MPVEIERKFLVAGNGWRAHVLGTQRLRQGYLAADTGITLRVRTIDDARAVITIKAGGPGLSRNEFEYPIPIRDARQLLALATGEVLAKRRHTLDLPGGDWVLDEFEGTHAGLLLAEVELPTTDALPPLPSWLGDEVTSDPRYYNAALARLPKAGQG